MGQVGDDLPPLGAAQIQLLFQHLRNVGVSQSRGNVAGGLAFLVSEASIGAGTDERLASCKAPDVRV
jgi:hypothetical protein